MFSTACSYRGFRRVFSPLAVVYPLSVRFFFFRPFFPPVRIGDSRRVSSVLAVADPRWTRVGFPGFAGFCARIWIMPPPGLGPASALGRGAASVDPRWNFLRSGVSPLRRFVFFFRCWSVRVPHHPASRFIPDISRGALLSGRRPGIIDLSCLSKVGRSTGLRLARIIPRPGVEYCLYRIFLLPCRSADAASPVYSRSSAADFLR